MFTRIQYEKGILNSIHVKQAIFSLTLTTRTHKSGENREQEGKHCIIMSSSKEECHRE